MILRQSFFLAVAAISAFSSFVLSAQQFTPADVSILLSAKDKYGRVITNLRKEDIRIIEDGSVRPITRFEKADDLPISIEVLVDTSASTKNQSAAVPVLAKAFLQLTIRKAKDTASITSFSRSASLVQAATDDVLQLDSAIDRIVMQPAVGTTALYSTIMDAAHRLVTAPGRRIVLVISDGGENSSNTTRGKLIETLQKNDVAVYAMYCFCTRNLAPGDFAVSFDIEAWGSMRRLTEPTGGTAYLPAVAVAPAVERDLRELAREMAAQKVVSFQPGRHKDSQRLQKIRVEGANPELKGLEFKYRRRY
jgi:Ca-activated chloride channel family protein